MRPPMWNYVPTLPAVDISATMTESQKSWKQQELQDWSQRNSLGLAAKILQLERELRNHQMGRDFSMIANWKRFFFFPCLNSYGEYGGCYVCTNNPQSTQMIINHGKTHFCAALIKNYDNLQSYLTLYFCYFVWVAIVSHLCWMA